MAFSMTPVLVTIELGFLLSLAQWTGPRRGPQSSATAVLIYLLWLGLYAVATSILGIQGFYVRSDLGGLYPGPATQLLTVVIAVLPVVLFSGLRNMLRDMADHTPWHWFAAFHALRIGALGTAYNTYIGEFPVYFELLVGVPDLLFGLSALWVFARARKGRISDRGFLIWNVIGLLIIVPTAPILLFLGLPGPFQMFTALPDARAVFTYPMSIAPVIGVPLFVLINLWVVWRLWERGALEQRSRTRAT